MMSSSTVSREGGSNGGGRILHLDFETFCELNLKDVSMHKYIRHKSFDVLCFAYALNKEDIKLWEPSQPLPEDFIALVQDPSVLIAAWNAGFERCVLNRMAQSWKYDKLPPERFIDVMALATRLNYPKDLDSASQIISPENVKDSAGKALINKLCKPKKWYQSTPFTRWTPDLDPHSFRAFYDYCKQDVSAERSVYRKIGGCDLPPFEKKIWCHTVKVNQRGIHIDEHLVRQIIDCLGEYGSELQGRLIKHTGGRVTTGNQRDRIIDEFERITTIRLPNLTADTVTRYLEDESIDRRARRLLWFRKKLSKTSTAKFNKMLAAINRDGTVKDNLIYAPTVTGRYTHVGLQIGNLPARVKFKHVVRDEYRTLSELQLTERSIEAFRRGLDAVKELTNSPQALASLMVRPCLLPPDGYEWVVGDWSSVENRLLHWEAHDKVTLHEFEKGLDQYKTFATAQFGVEYDDVSDEQRFRGKTAILGLGYMMGWKTYQATCEGYGLMLSEQQCKDDVNLYRSKYEIVRSFWYKLYDAAKEAVAQPGDITKFNNIYFRVNGDRLWMRLPTGRCVVYNNPLIEWKDMPWKRPDGTPDRRKMITFMGINPYTRKWSRMQITPGRLTENLIQADSREILVRGKMNVEEKGYRVLGSLHDEILSVRKIGEGSTEEFSELMCQMGDWANGLPLAATAWKGMRYRKE